MSPEFDPQISYVKVLLGRLRLYELTKNLRPRPPRIDTIMEEVALAEDRTGIARLYLCELIDSTMSILDFGHPDLRPNSYWCLRWSILARLRVREWDK